MERASMLLVGVMSLIVNVRGGLAVRNLFIAKHALLAKHVFKYLNHDSVLWVDILISKYGYMNFWHNSTPANCSVFFGVFAILLIF